jgi:hypothetical protein
VNKEIMDITTIEGLGSTAFGGNINSKNIIHKTKRRVKK